MSFESELSGEFLFKINGIYNFNNEKNTKSNCLENFIDFNAIVLLCSTAQRTTCTCTNAWNSLNQGINRNGLHGLPNWQCNTIYFRYCKNPIEWFWLQNFPAKCYSEESSYIIWDFVMHFKQNKNRIHFNSIQLRDFISSTNVEYSIESVDERVNNVFTFQFVIVKCVGYVKIIAWNWQIAFFRCPDDDFIVETLFSLMLVHCRSIGIACQYLFVLLSTAQHQSFNKFV